MRVLICTGMTSEDCYEKITHVAEHYHGVTLTAEDVARLVGH